MFPRILRTMCRALPVVVLLAGTASGVQARPGAAGLPGLSISPIGTDAHPQLPAADGSFTISLAIRNFTLDPSHIGIGPNRQGFGHYHIYADGIDPRFPFKYYVAASATTVARVNYIDLARAGVGPGLHTLYVALANNDHSLIEPLALASTVVRVVVPTPPIGLQIVGPVGTAGAPLLPGDDGIITFPIAVQHFTFDPASIGIKANRPGVGHYHVYADGIDPRFPFKYYVGAAAVPTVRVTLLALERAGITTGTHTLIVALANNDHSLLRPLVMASTVIRLGPAIQVAELSNPMQPVMVPANGKVTLHVSVMGFRLDAHQIGARANAPGSGHYLVFVQGFDVARPLMNAVAAGAGPAVDVTAAALAKQGVRSGIYPIYVVLANNDNSLVTPITAASGLVQIEG